MTKEVLLVVAHEGFQPVEYENTKKTLEWADLSVTVASTISGKAISSIGDEIDIDKSIKDVSVDSYDAIVLIGGPGANAELRDNNSVDELLLAADKSEKVIAAICITPVILAEAGLLKGKKATVWNEDGKQDEVLTSNGAEYNSDSVVVDGRYITANGPSAAVKFGNAIVESLQDKGSLPVGE